MNRGRGQVAPIRTDKVSKLAERTKRFFVLVRSSYATFARSPASGATLAKERDEEPLAGDSGPLPRLASARRFEENPKGRADSDGVTRSRRDPRDARRSSEQRDRRSRNFRDPSGVARHPSARQPSPVGRRATSVPRRADSYSRFAPVNLFQPTLMDRFHTLIGHFFF